MLKYFSDKLLVKLATIFGFPDESFAAEKEVINLKKALLDEKLKHQDGVHNEIIELRTKVERLNNEKVFLLEQEILRLQIENAKLSHKLENNPPMHIPFDKASPIINVDPHRTVYIETKIQNGDVIKNPRK